jgi:lactoylglutathione lyase
MLKKLTPNLMVEDVAETIAFYRDVLGFTLLATVPPEGDSFGWASMQRDNVTLMFQSRDSIAHDLPALDFASIPVGASQTFYIEVADIDSIYAAIKDRVDVIAELHTTFYDTREFYFRDCNGYILSFSEPVN